ncbi:acyltransferase family protein [Leclercia adecarboxylata]|uniref:Acyltransferase family protein n=1 Tax=Leclercia adecarboxylata TaxID=83655 RepID=A0ABU6I4T5_9ENTR|nr:acyltransferase family protein [Leclercia adecarboxylata]MBZ3802116.1 acyltransferase family protein [Leclercia adecarboxylata]MBZ3806746.1 acyltransferase family protein [Leclercia adecarboxylata]MDV5238916.1 acyltransferase family protein [Leclercia adecarboxylata]MDV5279778.1 acyltransferase family protein [Leclercia adecarboxylata]MDV5461961.1 acyltransferase family protein [Leclercia adecarboxylata]
MKQKALWINQIKGLCICLVVIYHSVITFYPHLEALHAPLSVLLAKCWVTFNLYLAPFRMPVFFFISGYLVRRYIDEVDWKTCVDKRLWSIIWVLALWGVLQWQALTHLNAWLAPDRDLNTASNAAYADSLSGFITGMLTASTSLWYLYALVVYFTLCKLLSRWKLPLIGLLALVSIAINFLPLPWWGMNSVVRNMIYYSLGAWYGVQLMAWMQARVWRRDALAVAAFGVVSVVLWFVGVPLPLSLLSILLIMALFYRFEQRFSVSPDNLLNVVGSNTIAIYTTHRILIEGVSLFMIHQLNSGTWPVWAELMVVLLYPFASLLVCTLVGLGARKLSTALTGDFFFSPPARLTPVQATR